MKIKAIKSTHRLSVLLEDRAFVKMLRPINAVKNHRYPLEKELLKRFIISVLDNTTKMVKIKNIPDTKLAIL